MSKEQPPQQPLFVEAGAVQERSVTIRVLTIGTKQVTQTLYRQLVEENILGLQAQIKGTVWGWVNVHVDCENKEKHLHVVWEDKGTLKRGTVKADYEESQGYKNLRMALVDAAHAYICATALEGSWFKRPDGTSTSRNPLTLSVNSTPVTVSYIDAVQTYRLQLEYAQRQQEALDILIETGPRDTPVSHQFDVEEARKKVAQNQTALETLRKQILPYVERVIGPLEGHDWSTRKASIDAHMALEEVERAMRTYEKTWIANYKKLEASGQLFIAVSGVWK